MRRSDQKTSSEGRWGARGRWLVAAVVQAFLLMTLFCPAGAAAEGVRELDVRPAADLSGLTGRPIARVRVELLGSLWHEEFELTSVRPGDLFRPELVRRGLEELEATGRAAEVTGAVESIGSHVELIFSVTPRRVVAAVRIEGSPIDPVDVRRALALGPDDELTEAVLQAALARVEAECRAAGYPLSQVNITAAETDDPLRMLVRVRIEAGALARVERVDFRVAPSPHHPDLAGILHGVRIRRGMPLHVGKIAEATETLTGRLVAGAFYLAETTFRIEGRVVIVEVRSGPKFSLLIEGAQNFGSDELTAALGLAAAPETRPEALEDRLREFLVKQGFLDAVVRFRRSDSKDGLRSEIRGWVREHTRFSVARRRYPCRTGIFSARELDAEVEGVLTEQFPGVGLIHPPNAEDVDAALGSSSASPRATPLEPAPYTSYSEPAYQAVRHHLESLYRSEAYLRAEVGPIHLDRRTCSSRSPPGQCIPLGQARSTAFDCAAGVSATDDVEQSCVSDPARGQTCEPEGDVLIPVHAGPRAVLYDVSLSGNERFAESQLLALAKLPLGAPARPQDIEFGLQRIKDFYADQAYAFAAVDSELTLSPDGTRARLVISIEERDKVKVRRIDVRGATRTRESLIRKRLALAEGDFYYRPLVLKSQTQVESLGVFAGVAIALEDPGIPAKEKVVVVTLTERLPQYVDTKGGFATADGFRIGFEYGHRNLGGNAISLMIRSQLGLRPVFLIPEEDVRAKYSELDWAELLERRNAITLGLPEVGLGPQYRFEAELLDIRDNNRDYGLNRDAALLRLLQRPHKTLLFSLGATVEYNNAEVFAVPVLGPDGQPLTDENGNIITEKDQLDDYLRQKLQDDPTQVPTIRVPEGPSIAFAQELRGSWDRRDQKLSATRGTFLGLGVEHVTALPLPQTGADGNPVDLTCRPRDGSGSAGVDLDSKSVFDPTCSEFLRLTGRLAGYIPLSKKGTSLAISLKSGFIVHLSDVSSTYPDRLFFVGGVDTIRGYQQDSLVPQDYADSIQADPALGIESVVLRGGDFFINPRVELRIPLGRSLQTAIFLDTGNLWADPTKANLTQLRYAIGTGLRVQTPIGPLVFDYGFNMEQLFSELGLFDALGWNVQVRDWEDIGAFHFSVGLF